MSAPPARSTSDVPDAALRRLERQVRWLRAYAASSAVVFVVVLAASAFRPGAALTRSTELDVERLNVRAPGGRLAVVIATPARLPGNVMRGRERRDGPRGGGLLFYDAQGNEAGGLLIDSRLRVVDASAGPDGQPRRDTLVHAGAQLSLDRYESDQVAAPRYTEDSAQWSAGLHVSHFARHGSAEWMDGRDAVDRLPAAQLEVAALGAWRDGRTRRRAGSRRPAWEAE